MTSEEKSAQYQDMSANERLLEIQEEIIKIENQRIGQSLNQEEKDKLKEKIKFLVSEQRMIFEARYAKQKDIKDSENPKSAEEEVAKKAESEEIKQILKQEIAEDEKIEGDLKEIIEATKSRMWYERWWGKLLIILIGAAILGFFEINNTFLNNLLG